ncbi:MAG: restriction endonuclease [Candidatus Liptonbacteria bacterium]|nr:restriction endonuclease [Parcubacteria group bacterium]MBI4086227.1 restriction endonuclease [Candidatus Liptonbacteria bacterium]
MNKEYIKKLENIIKTMLTPLKGIPFNLVIESLSGNKVIPFNINDKKDIALLKKLKLITIIAGKEVNKRGILRPRPNEVGNDIEPFIKKTLNRIGYKADTPFTSGGDKKSTGYPDIEFLDEFGRVNYLECKTFNIENISTSQRSFYLSPSENFKVTRDAHHFVVSFEVYVVKKRGTLNVYKCRSWKILDINALEVDVKYEFNADNKRMYGGELILAEGKI